MWSEWVTGGLCAFCPCGLAKPRPVIWTSYGVDIHIGGKWSRTWRQKRTSSCILNKVLYDVLYQYDIHISFSHIYDALCFIVIVNEWQVGLCRTSYGVDIHIGGKWSRTRQLSFRNRWFNHHFTIDIFVYYDIHIAVFCHIATYESGTKCCFIR